MFAHRRFIDLLREWDVLRQWPGVEDPCKLREAKRIARRALRWSTRGLFVHTGTREDFTDLFHILLGRHWDLPLGDGYEPLATQQPRHVRAKQTEHAVPHDPALRRIESLKGCRNDPAKAAIPVFCTQRAALG